MPRSGVLSAIEIWPVVHKFSPAMMTNPMKLSLQAAKKFTIGATGAALCLGLPSVVIAQNAGANPLIGAWHGTVDNYKGNANPSRELFIAADGTCYFDFPKVKRPDKAQCVIDSASGTIELQTAWKVRVTLKLAPDGSLQGHFYSQHQTYAHTRSDFRMIRGRMP